MIILLVLILGGFVGFISAFLGLGGGVVIVPLLPEILPISSHEAVATSLFTIFLVVANNCISFHRKRTVVWSVALVIGPLTAIGAFVSGKFAQALPEVALRGILAGVVVVVFVRALFRIIKRDVVESPHAKEGLSDLSMAKKLATGGVGIFAGLLSGISGIGAGLVISPLLIQLNLVKNEKVAPTANGVMLFNTFFGALAFASFQSVENWKWGYVHLDAALLLAGAAFFTSYFARKFQGKLPLNWRLGLLSLLLFLLAIKMWVEVFHLM